MVIAVLSQGCFREASTDCQNTSNKLSVVGGNVGLFIEHLLVYRRLRVNQLVPKMVDEVLLPLASILWI